MKSMMQDESAATPLRRVGVSSWALHRMLGEPTLYGPEHGSVLPEWSPEEGTFPLEELPAAAAARGLRLLQFCHFHFRTRKPEQLDALRERIRQAGAECHALLVDAGDLTHPVQGERDAAWVADWLPVAERIGAAEVRVIAGKTTGPGALELSARRLVALAEAAAEGGLRITVENWYRLLATPQAVNELLDRCEGRVGLQVDFGNWSGKSKYDDLAAIAPRAVSCHVEVAFDAGGTFDRKDLERCLALPFPPGFDGPFILVNSGPQGWAGLEAVGAAIREEN